MKAAISTLEIALNTLQTNEPIHRKEGKLEQADLEAQNAGEIRRALDILRVIEKVCYSIYAAVTDAERRSV